MTEPLHVAGEPAPKVGKWEEIGPAECPLMYRRTLLSGRVGKLLLHRFVPNARDRDCHDHPRSFVTFVLRGGYTDVSVCPKCVRSRAHVDHPCWWCDSTGRVVDEVRAPTIRYRRADHAHNTIVGPRGCTTIVVMGPVVRAWGFVRKGRWWDWRSYERTFGMAFRCDDE